MSVTSNLTRQFLEKYPWLWAVSASWCFQESEEDIIEKHMLTADILQTHYEPYVTWWFYYVIDTRLERVMPLDSALPCDRKDRVHSSVAHRMLSLLTRYDYHKKHRSIEVLNVVSHRTDSRKGIYHPYTLYMPSVSLGVIELALKTCGVSSMDEYSHMMTSPDEVVSS